MFSRLCVRHGADWQGAVHEISLALIGVMPVFGGPQ
jgi:hypothetical protein